MWTKFWDMGSGGTTKQKPYEKIYIEAPEDEAMRIFYSRFGHWPLWVGCNCCGENYSVSEHETLDDATGYHRVNNAWVQTLEEYIQRPDVLTIFAPEIAPEERSFKEW